MNRKIIIIIVAAAISVVAAVVAIIASGDGNREETNVQDTMENIEKDYIYDMETSMGTIRIKLYNRTPKHRDNFRKLAAEGFYDGTLFHRVIDGFMIQGGDPLSKDTTKRDFWGTGGPGYTVPAEFVSEYTHRKGAIAAARRGDMANPAKASSGSQFYLVQDEANCAQLDGEYTVYGQAIDGLDVIDRIAATATDFRDRPLKDVTIISVREVVAEPAEPADSTASADSL